MSTAYPGNPSLPAEVKERVVSTFRQTVNLYKAGRSDEVRAGCDFILKMDAFFDPAKRLMEKTNDPNLPIDVDSLLPNGGSPLDEARAALASRDFQRAIDLCNDVLARDPSNADAQQLAAQATEKMEAAPFVEQFISSCRAQIASANEPAARTSLEKARALDPDHPDIAALEMELSAISDSPAPPVPSGFDFSASFGSAADASSSGFGFGDPSSSFVVDSAAPPAATPAAPPPASEFGFTFEEEKTAPPAAGFSFEPAAPPPSAEPAFSFGGPEVSVGEASTFDFATGAVEVSSDDASRIAKYLEEGDALFEQGEYANAIDTWSRIFLIDVTNEQASERIERARGKRLEMDQQVEELMVAATLAFEKKDFTTARAKFEEILRIDPNNFNAAEYLEKLSDTASLAAAPAGAAARPGADVLDDFGMEDAAAPAPAAAPRAKAAPKAAAAAPEKEGASKLLVMSAVVGVVIVLLAGGWFAYTKFFASKSGVSESETRATFNKAQSLADAGKFDQAIQLLTKISSPENPQHERALEMIADLQKKKSESSGRIGGRPAVEVFNERIAAARAAFDAHDYVAAKEQFDKAAEIEPNFPPDLKAMYETAAQQVSKLDSAMVFFKEGNYTEAIVNLESLLQQDPANTNIRQLLANAHYNLGVLALQEERTADAMTEFGKVLEHNPNDELAKRSRGLAERYDGQQKDLLYKIFVKYLAFR